MKKQQRLGQNFLISKSVAKSIVDAANITKNDIVLEIGTGEGILLPFLCKNAKKVISIESDKELFNSTLSKYGKTKNLDLKHSDGFKSEDYFSILVSNLPYSKSKKAFEWLIQKKFSHAVLMVQKEFANKILSPKKDRRSISVLVNYVTDVEHIMDVNPNNFFPRPKVNSAVIKLTWKKKISKELIHTVYNLFSYRRKTIQNILKQFDEKVESNKRLDDLSNEEIIKIAKRIIKKH